MRAMQNGSRCPTCDASIPRGVTPCPDCGSFLAGSQPIAVEPLREEAAVVYGLLQSAGLHPVLAYYDESGVPHPIDAEENFQRGAGLMVPVTTSFAIYVPEGEAQDSEAILADARRERPEADTPDP